jgi:single-strand DNA-binding protein
MANIVILVGNVGADPEFKLIKDKSFVKFSLATNLTKKVNDENIHSVEWHNICAWGGTADLIAKYVVKGMKLVVRGSLHYHVFEKDGIKMKLASIVAQEVEFLNRVGSDKPFSYGMTNEDF